MTGYRRVLALIAVASIALLGVVAPKASADPTVYDTPGGNIAGGRLWRTSCEKYSSNVVRCRAEIWATQVVRVGGVFQNRQDWYFNNLSYLPSPRSSWVGNPLAANGVVGGSLTWTSGGRQWRTECDTAVTGGGACRSYIWSTEVVAVPKPGGGYKFLSQTKWVFNNLVLFSSASAPAVTAIPAHILDQSPMDANGIWPLQIGYSMADYGRLGYSKWKVSDPCNYWADQSPLTSRGISLIGRNIPSGRVFMVSVSQPGVRTTKGVQVGMTIGQAKAAYGTDFKVLPKTNYGETQYFGSVKSMDLELMFRVAGPGDTYAPTTPLTNGQVIGEIQARHYSDDVSFDGC